MEKSFEKSPVPEEGGEKEHSLERGTDVQIRLKIIRHGERTKEGELTDYGREVTRKKARKRKGKSREEFDAVKAYGSPAGPKGQAGMARSLETADIYAGEVGKDKKFKTREAPVLSYETLILPPPYNHIEVYNANLPENFEQLPDEEKAKAAKKAQSATTNHLLSLDSPEAQAFKREVAGAFAVLIKSRGEMSSRLKNGSKVLMLAGTHGPMPELFLQEALVRESEDGTEIRGFRDIDEIGGPLNPSESFNVEIIRDKNGRLQKLFVEFDDPERPYEERMYLDPEKLDELAEYYKELHERK